MRFAVFLPNFGPFGDTDALVQLALDAEASGWHGFFIWDHIQLDGADTGPMVDPWVALTAVAAATSSLRIGTMITPLARRRPWKVARETVTLDRFSGGRLTLGVGLGYPPEAEFGTFGEETDDRVRAAKLDEGLDILDGLWSGGEFSYDGEHYKLAGAAFQPRPLQEPRIPVWCGGWWPNRRPFRRAARWDGVAPELVAGGHPDPLPTSPRSPPLSARTAAASHSTSRSTATPPAAATRSRARSPSTGRPVPPGGWSASTPSDFSTSTKHNSESTLAPLAAVRTTAVQTRKEHHETSATAQPGIGSVPPRSNLVGGHRQPGRPVRPVSRCLRW